MPDGFNVGDDLEIASRVAALVPDLGHLTGHLMAVTNLSLDQFSRRDRLLGCQSPASASGSGSGSGSGTRMCEYSR